MIVWQFCHDYAKDPAHGRRLLIHGENGTGKSRTAKAIFHWASRMAIDLPWVDAPVGLRLAQAQIVNWPRLVDQLKQGEWDRIDDLMEADLLILDDIGSEHDPSKVGQEKLYLLLEHREDRWTVLTTNITPDKWATWFDRRIASRFFRNFQRVSLEHVPDFACIVHDDPHH